MPLLDDYLHYRMVDVSSVKELTRRWYPRVYFGQPTKGLAHRALADIQESIQELEYYRRTVFVPLPGPDVDQAKAVAAELTAAREDSTTPPASQPQDDGNAVGM
jgi:oligoribonuclease